MNAGSLSLLKCIAMKASLFFKVFFILPLILFVEYVLMALLGCSTCFFGLGDEFYCGPFCIAGKIILALSAGYFGYLIYPEIKTIFRSKKNGPSPEIKKNL
jgi:hypothetical protein